jgi:DNA-binding transcriptional MerR regulator
LDTTRPLSDYSELRTARAFGLTTGMLRHYVASRLLNPIVVGNARFYSERDRVRLAVVQKATRLGFTLPEITALLDLDPVNSAKRTPTAGADPSSRRRGATDAVGMSRALIARGRIATCETLDHAALLRAAIEAQRTVLSKIAPFDGLWATQVSPG